MADSRHRWDDPHRHSGYEQYDTQPTHAIKLIEARVAITPLPGSLRMAGTLEIVDGDESISRNRLKGILQTTEQYLSLPQQPKLIETWRRLRPCTPDGVPIIGRSPRWKNLHIATGHQMLGLLTGPSTGERLAQLMCDEQPQLDPHAFRPERF